MIGENVKKVMLKINEYYDKGEKINTTDFNTKEEQKILSTLTEEIWLIRIAQDGEINIENIKEWKKFISQEIITKSKIEREKEIKINKEIEYDEKTANEGRNIWWFEKKNKKGEIAGIKIKPAFLSRHIRNEEYIVSIEKKNIPYIYQNGYYIYGKNIIQKKIDEHIPQEHIREIDIIDTYNAVRRKTLSDIEEIEKNREKNILNIENGLLNLNELSQNEFPFSEHIPNHISFFQLPLQYDRKAKCPKFIKFVKSLLKGNEEAEKEYLTIQEFFGFTLLKDSNPFKKALIFYGGRDTGKSTLLGILRELYGLRNISSESLQSLGDNTFRLAQLEGKMVNLCSDNPKIYIKDAGLIKSLLSGKDAKTSEKKGKDANTVVFHTKFMFSANELPEVADDTDAFYEKIIIINFNNIFGGTEKDEKDIDIKLVKEESTGILNWMIEGLKRLIRHGKFSYENKNKQMDWNRKANPVDIFLQEKIVEDEEEHIFKNNLYIEYQKYAEKYHLPILKNNIFGKKLNQRYRFNKKVNSAHIEDIDGKQKYAWNGIRLKTVEEEIEEKEVIKVKDKEEPIVISKDIIAEAERIEKEHIEEKKDEMNW